MPAYSARYSASNRVTRSTSTGSGPLTVRTVAMILYGDRPDGNVALNFGTRDRGHTARPAGKAGAVGPTAVAALGGSNDRCHRLSWSWDLPPYCLMQPGERSRRAECLCIGV